MISWINLVVFLTIIATPVLALEIPSNVQDFYKFVRGRDQCKNVLASGFHSSDGDSGGKNHNHSLCETETGMLTTPDFDYCGDYLDKYNIIYLQGKDGQLVNMDVDCDGAQGESDGRCSSSTDTQPETTFRDELRDYRTSQRDLNASVHPFVVFGNEGTKKGWPTFDPQKHGVEPLSVMAVVCNNKLVCFFSGRTLFTVAHLIC